MKPLLLLLLLVVVAPCRAETLAHGRFEKLTIYRPAGSVQRLVLFLSGEYGWTAQLEHSAQLLASQGAMVAGIDAPALYAALERDGSECVYPDGDLENLSHFLQAYYRLPSYEPPLLVGYGTGASFAYAMIAQAPPETFAGAVSIHFCPELQLRKPLCRSGKLRFAGPKKQRSVLAPTKLDVPWIALQTRADGACGKAATQKFVDAARGSEMIDLTVETTSPKWEAALTSSTHRFAVNHPPPAVAPEELEGLPLVEVAAAKPGTTLALLLSGDGGWAGIDKAVAAALSAHGVAVVGLDSLRYFWKSRTPQSAASDVERILNHYLAAWNRKDAVLIGYSQGADVLPFIVNRLSPQMRPQVRLSVLMGLGELAVFEFHLGNWLSGPDDGLPIRPELGRMSEMPVLCIYGTDEHDSLCPSAASRTLRAVSLPGGHHFGGDYERLAALILQQMARTH